MQHIEQYLIRANAGNTTAKRRRDAWDTFLNLIGLGGAAYLWLGPPDFSFWLSLGLFIAWSATASGILKSVHQAREGRLQRRNPLAAQISERIAELDDFRAKGTLAERFHPRVAAGLEACASLHSQIVDGLASANWQARNPGAEWAKIAQQAQEAADNAMQQAVLACSGAFRPKGLARKTWERQVERDPVREEVCSRLGSIEGELRDLYSALGVQSATTASSISDVLSTLAEIRRAEEELDASTLHIGSL